MRIVAALGCLVLLSAAWFFLAPTELGGRTSYVIVYGKSMTPRFRAGGLVVVRRGGPYRVGQVVAYRNAALDGQPVLHRIIGVHGGRYTFKGDANDFVDSFRPTSAGMIGRSWLRVPGLGRWVLWTRVPRHLLLLGGAGVLIALAFLLSGGGPVRRRPDAGVTSSRSEPPLPGLGVTQVAAAVALVGFAALAVLSFTRPSTAVSVRQDLYRQTGRLDYEASAPEGEPVYGDTTVRTGEPLFLRLVHAVRFRFAYRFASSAPHSVAGRIGLDAEVAAPNGWRRHLVVAAPRAFAGDRAVSAGTLDLESLSSLLTQVATLSNVNAGTYRLTLLPRVELHGTVAGESIREHLAPRDELLVDAYQVQLPPAGAAGDAAATLRQSTTGTGTTTAPNRLSLPGFRVPVKTARSISLGGLVIALLVLAGSLVIGWRRPRDERSAIERRYGDLIVPVLDGDWTTRSITEVGSIDGLARLADRSGRPIVRADAGDRSIYRLELDGTVYTYRCVVRRAGAHDTFEHPTRVVSRSGDPANA
jgi:hypothetical protein